MSGPWNIFKGANRFGRRVGKSISLLVMSIAVKIQREVIVDGSSPVRFGTPDFEFYV